MKVSAEHINRHSEEEFSKSLSILSDSGAGILHIRTQEVVRACKTTRKVILLGGHEYKEWDIVNGLTTYSISNMEDTGIAGDDNVDLNDAIAIAMTEILKKEKDETENYLYLSFVNPQYWLEDNPQLIHFLEKYNDILPPSRVRILLITPDMPLPNTINDLIVTLPFDTPSHSELKVYLEDIINGVEGWEDDEGRVSLDEDDFDDICHAGAGLSKANFEMYSSLAIVDAASRVESAVIVADDIIKGINKGKTEIINKNDILELYQPEDMKDVGGMENLKEWVSKRASCYSDEAQAFGIEPPRGIVFVGIPGCVGKDTELVIKRGNRTGGRIYTIEDAYYKFNSIPRDGKGKGGYRKGSKYFWDNEMPTFTLSSLPNGLIGYNVVRDIIDSGVKEVYEITTNTGRVLVATKDHPFMVSDKETFVKLKNLAVGDIIITRSDCITNTAPRSKRKKRIYIQRIINHPKAYTKNINGNIYYSASRSRLTIEAQMNGLALPLFISLLQDEKADVSNFKWLPDGAEVHHIDEDTLNDSPDNLEIMTKQQHAALHGVKNQCHFSNVLHQEENISSIEYAGYQQTYDISMLAPANNFVANGMVVHNSGKSLAAKAIARVFGVPLIRLDFGKMFNSFVGKSEERMRTALSMIESMAPVCILADTKITLSDGNKITIESMYEGLQLGKSYTLLGIDPENGKLINLSMSTIIRSKGKDMIRIYTKKGSIGVTLDHKLLVKRDGVNVWVKAKELEEGENLLEY